MSEDARKRYLARFNRVLDFIDTHLDEPLSVEGLSDIAHFSRYHFHRQFSAAFGVGVYEYVRLKRLKRASYELAFRQHTPVTDIALNNGYESPEAFARAFKRSIGQTPSDFRRRPDWMAWHASYQPLSSSRSSDMRTTDSITMSIEIVEFAQTRIAVLEHRGDPTTIGDSIRRFIAWRKQHGLLPSVSATFNVFYNNPTDVAPQDYRMDICAAITSDVPPNEQGVLQKVIPAGRCARLRHVGSDQRLGESIHRMYAQWLPDSGEALRDFPVFVQRLKFFPDVAENEAVTDIFLPLEAHTSA